MNVRYPWLKASDDPGSTDAPKHVSRIGDDSNWSPLSKHMSFLEESHDPYDCDVGLNIQKQNITAVWRVFH